MLVALDQAVTHDSNDTYNALHTVRQPVYHGLGLLALVACRVPRFCGERILLCVRWKGVLGVDIAGEVFDGFEQQVLDVIDVVVSLRSCICGGLCTASEWSRW